MSGLPTPRLRICNNPRCLTEFISASRQAFYCPECHRERRNAAKRERERLQREANPDAVREKRKRYYATHRVERRKSWRRYYENHRDECIAKSTKRQQENAEAHREAVKRYKQKILAQRLHQELPTSELTRATKKKNPTQVSSQNQIAKKSKEILRTIKKEIPQEEMHFCQRMRVKMKTLPCGQRGECYNGKKCEFAPEKPARKIINLFV